MRFATLFSIFLAALLMLGCQDSSLLELAADAITSVEGPGTVANGQALTPGESVPLDIEARSTGVWIDVYVVDDLFAPDPDSEPDFLSGVTAGMGFWLLQQGKVVLADFDGRCSQPSLWLYHFKAEGKGVHMGRLESVGSHCSYPPSAMGALPTYGDGQVTSTSANGDQLWLGYENGTATFTSDPNVGLFQDEVTVAGGMGRFTGATGEALETGRWDFTVGNFEVEIEGWISYRASDRS